MSTILVALSHSIAAVIPGDALVQSGSGVKMLHEVMSGEKVLSIERPLSHFSSRRMHDLAHMQVMSNVPAGRRNSTVQIDLGNRRINAAPDQLFFDPLKNEWVKAENLTYDNQLLDEDMQPVGILDVKRKRFMPLEARAVQVEGARQLYVDGVLVHNMDADTVTKGLAFLGTGAAWFFWKVVDVVVKKGIEKSFDAVRESTGGVMDNGRGGAGSQHRQDVQRNSEMQRSIQPVMTNAQREAFDSRLRGRGQSARTNAYQESADLKEAAAKKVAESKQNKDKAMPEDKDIIVFGVSDDASKKVTSSSEVPSTGKPVNRAQEAHNQSNPVGVPKATSEQRPGAAPKQASKTQEAQKSVYSRKSDGKVQDNPYSRNGKPSNENPYSRANGRKADGEGEAYRDSDRYSNGLRHAEMQENIRSSIDGYSDPADDCEFSGQYKENKQARKNKTKQV